MLACGQALRARPCGPPGGVTAAPAIRWVAARSGWGPEVVGMMTVMCCCSARWRAGSYGTPSCQHCHTIRHQARPRVRSARGCVARGGDRGRGRGRRRRGPAPRGASGGCCQPACRTRSVGACCSPSESTLLCVCRTRSQRPPGQRRRRARRGMGSAHGSRRSRPAARRR
jgi:hypothetical protein